VPALGVFGVNGVAYAPPGKPATVGAALNKRPDKRNDKKGDTLNSRPAHQDGPRPARQDGSYRHPSMLPKGTLCASGTCEFKHNGLCWRDPEVGVTLPKTMSAEIWSRIETARQENAKKKNITCQPCLYIGLGAQATAAAAAAPAASTSRVSDDGLGGGDVHEYSPFGFAGTVVTTNSSGDASAENGASVYSSDGEGSSTPSARPTTRRTS